jgi:sugar lactone lactonase YvrE
MAPVHPGRSGSLPTPRLAAGWTLERLTPPSRLFGANGLRPGADGRLYVAQCIGSQISAVDVDSGAIEVVSGLGGDIVAPDDIAFDERGALYATEVMDARVSVRDRRGATRVLRGDVPSANGITFHRGRLFIDECRPGGRLLELELDGGAPRVLADNLPMPNALAPGPDGKLYFPLVAANEIWRIGVEGGAPECVASGLDHPVAVKFDADGHIIAPQSGSGEVLRIDPRSGARTVAARLDPGLDNLAFIGNRLFVSHMTNGRITEIAADGASRSVLPGGLQFPLDMTTGPDGRIYFCDNCVLYALGAEGPREIGRLFQPGFPGTLRGLAAAGADAFFVTTTDGRVALYRPQAAEHDVLAEGLDQLYGAATAPGGAAIVAELGAGRVLAVGKDGVEELARGLDAPMGVAVAPDGTCFVTESGAGRVVALSSRGVRTVLDELRRPQGVALADGMLYVADAGAKTVVAHDLATGRDETIAVDLPIGAPPGISPKPLRGFPPFSGPLGPFAGLTAGPGAALYLSADAEGAVIALRRVH